MASGSAATCREWKNENSVLEQAHESARLSIRRRFYIGISLVMAMTAIVGFWSTYFGPLVRGTIEQPLVIHFHATVFVGWLVPFLAQVSLAATGHVSWHVKLGRIGIGYGLLVIVVGLVTGIIRSADRVVAGGNAAQLLYVAFLDIALFSVFFGAAIVFRRKPQLHKRLMLVAATILVVAAVFRLSFLPAAPLRVRVRLILWSVPILLAIVLDLRSRQPIHQVYVFGLVALLIRNYSVSLSQTDAWSAITRRTTALVL